MSVHILRTLVTRDMQFFVHWAFLLLFSIRCSYGSRVQVEKLSANSNRNILECLKDLISVRSWAVHDFSVIFDEIDFVDYNFFQRFPNNRWELHSVRNFTLTGFSNVIFFTSNFDSFRAILSVINFRPMDSRAKFVIAVTKNFASLDEIKVASQGIPAAMWNLDKTHVVYLVPCKEDVFATTYFPFARNCQVGEVEVLDVWNRKNFVNGVELFPEKILDIRGCVQNHAVVFSEFAPLHNRKEFTKTGEMILGGVGGRLITIVAEKLNMKLHSVILPPDSWSLLAYKVRRGESIFSVIGTIPIAGQLEFLDLDAGYMEESFGFGYNVSDYKFSWKNLVWPLSNEVWQCIGYIGLLFCGLLFLANRYHRSEIISDKLSILKGFGIFLGITQVLPRSYFTRYLFGMWIVYSYLISVAYNSRLVSFLTTPKENSVIDTFEELLTDGIDFGGAAFHREFYHDPSDPVMMKIHNNFKIWSENNSARLFYNGQGVTGVLSSYVRMYNSNQTGISNHQMHMLKEKAFTFQVPIPMRRGSPFTLGVRRYTSRAIQGGFRDYWLKYYTHKSSSARIGSNTPTVISMQHIRGILYLYIAGLIFSCMVFFGEFIFYYYFRNRGSR